MDETIDYVITSQYERYEAKNRTVVIVSDRWPIFVIWVYQK